MRSRRANVRAAHGSGLSVQPGSAPSFRPQADAQTVPQLGDGDTVRHPNLHAVGAGFEDSVVRPAV